VLSNLPTLRAEKVTKQDLRIRYAAPSLIKWVLLSRIGLQVKGNDPDGSRIKAVQPQFGLQFPVVCNRR
jgi:hypothetical protein